MRDLVDVLEDALEFAREKPRVQVVQKDLCGDCENKLCSMCRRGSRPDIVNREEEGLRETRRAQVIRDLQRLINDALR